MKLFYLLVMALAIFSGTASAEVSFKVGIGEYKNKQSTSSFSLELSTRDVELFKSSDVYLTAQLNSVSADYALHDADELLLGAGYVIADGFYAEALFSDETYSGSLKTKLFFPGNRSFYGLAEVNHRNLYVGGLKRTQAAAGVGWQFSDYTALEVIYKTGNFHSDFVSDQLLFGITWSAK